MYKKECNVSKSRVKGFTLIELLVVVAILALLAGIVGPQVMKRLGDSKSKAAKIQIEELSTALEMYKIDTNRYPTTEQTLDALVQQPAGVDGWNAHTCARSLYRRIHGSKTIIIDFQVEMQNMKYLV